MQKKVGGKTLQTSYVNASLRHITALAVEAGEALWDVVGPLAVERGEGVEARVALVEGAARREKGNCKWQRSVQGKVGLKVVARSSEFFSCCFLIN